MDGDSVVSDETKTIDSVTKTVDSVTKTVDSVTKTVDSVTETVDSVTKTVDSVTKTVDSVTETVDSVMETANPESSAETLAADEPMVVDDSPEVELTILHNKDKFTVSTKLSSTISMLKHQLFSMIGVPVGLQKIMIKGIAKDHETLKSLNVTSSSKIMVVGAKLWDIVTVCSNIDEAAFNSDAKTKEPLCKNKLHMKVLEQWGKPVDAMVGILNVKYPLPPYPLRGMINKHGQKVRLLIKFAIKELWISTTDQTQKIKMYTIRHMVSGPIEGHTEYHIVGFLLGRTEASRYWVYWVPVQYIDSLKKAIKDTRGS